MFFDVLIVSVMFVVFEFRFKKHSYIFSPYTMFVLAFNFIFLVPYYMTTLPVIGDFVRVGRLSADDLKAFEWYARVFFYSWLPLAIYFVSRSNLSQDDVRSDLTNANRSSLWVLLISVIAITLIFLGLGTEFSPSTMLRRSFFPREFTDIKMGMGPFIFLKQAVCGVLLVSSSFNAIKRRSVRSYLILLIALTLNFIGGTKTSFVINFLVIFMVYQKIGLKKTAATNPLKNIFVLLCLAPVILSAVIGSFFVMGDKNSSVDQIQRIGRYQAEGYYTALVLNDYKWKSEYLISGLSDTAFAYIPRAIFPDKPTVGFYRNYWKERYEPNTPAHHTSTFGALAESFMMFGYSGAFLYGLIFAFICKLSDRLYLKSDNVGSLFFAIYSIYWLYFLMRAGLTGFAVAQPLMIFIFTYFIWNKKFKW